MARLLCLLGVAAGHNPNNPDNDNEKGHVAEEWHCHEPGSVPLTFRNWTDAATGTTYSVEVLRRQPLVAAVRGFATFEERAAAEQIFEHWMRHPRSSFHSKGVGQANECGSWFDVLPNYSIATPLARQTQRLTALLRHLGEGEEANYDDAAPSSSLRFTPYNANRKSRTWNKGAWCTPHCDAPCNGERLDEAPKAPRAVGIVWYKVAEDGGSNNLARGTVRFRATAPGDLLVTGLKASGTQYDTDGSTEHAGCPVWRGEKWISQTRIRASPGIDDVEAWERRPDPNWPDYYHERPLGERLVLRRHPRKMGGRSVALLDPEAYGDEEEDYDEDAEDDDDEDSDDDDDEDSDDDDDEDREEL